MTPSLPDVAYKVLTSAQMAQFKAEGVFRCAPVDLADGYIHLSTAGQLTETVDRHFAGQDGLHVVAVALAPLGEAVRWEPSRGGALFPHIYADLPWSAAIAHGPLQRDAAGQVMLPVAG
ncbi:MAG: DUF952 domain-containing protein [Novosphingobium sp.]